MAPRKKDSNETPKKKEFGTGLRAQLEKRREEPEAAKAADAQPNVELRFELTARPADLDGATVDLGATAKLREELAAAVAREQELKVALEQQRAMLPVALEDEQNVARRAAALDDRDAKLTAFQTELEERERKVRDQSAAIEEEHRRLAEVQAELAAAQATSEESHRQAETKLRELKSFD